MATETPNFENKERESSKELLNVAFAKRKCCFCIFYLSLDQSKIVGQVGWKRIRLVESKDGWRMKAWKKARQWSKIMAGPKWKTFIQRINKNNRGSGGGRLQKFQYNPLSCALNFDDGPRKNGNLDDEIMYRDFSSWFVSIPISAESSMDLGKDMPAFT
ncbi:PREDICTED: uncharacterized protein LOC104612679 [Nelumbo nucifera]|uniref:Uncharacterized protein n=2 Tax=Nelumbo nucifera TaxID=4432 RepID=A0A822ZSE3_NELNU|nr:PREDICTED: uncharacterized protein LOC104612679 [Nelumbo nucifera]DAD46325.1 TPA_asm: hypothetical protein HUJ06_004555 [Nelumbo nucifera]